MRAHMARPGEIEAYPSPISGPPGTSLSLHVSSTSPVLEVAAYRIGAYEGGRGRQIWSGKLNAQVQPGPKFAEATRTTYAGWPAATSIDTTSIDTTDWPPGYYVITLTGEGGRATSTIYVVSSPQTSGTVSLVMPTATWQAYNTWGGRSLYEGPPPNKARAERSWAVSYDRPFPIAGPWEFYSSALEMAVVAEASGVDVSWLTDVDVARDPDILRGTRAVAVYGHDEYWTVERRRAVDEARDAGSNVLIATANTMYWRARFEPGLVGAGPHRLLTAYKDAGLDPITTTDPAHSTWLFGYPPAADPTERSIGLRYECYPADADFTVRDPGWWGFADAATHEGESFANLFGYEMDRYYPSPAAPEPMHLIADGAYGCRGVPTSGQAVEFAVPSGASVVNLNSIYWTCALDRGCSWGGIFWSQRTNEFTRAVTTTILREFAKGPNAKRHPVVHDIDRLQLPAERTVYQEP